MTIEDNVFIGHGVTFINDTYPRATTADGELQTEADWKVETDAGQERRIDRLGRTILAESDGRRERHRGRGQRGDEGRSGERDRRGQSGPSIAEHCERMGG